ncbi:MAG: hypothetical protein Q8865_09590 [Bacillota bacterium]|nr:hypothetical protein [Bacillota bacterium]
MKGLLHFIVTHILVAICYLILCILPLFFHEFYYPLIVIFTWILGPILTVILIAKLLNFIKFNRSYILIAISFLLNFTYILIYTWFENQKPRIPGDFIDVRGVYLLIFGYGQISGVVFCILCALYFYVKKKKKNHEILKTNNNG